MNRGLPIRNTYNAEGNRVGIIGTETTLLVIDPQGALPKVLLRTKNGVTTRYGCIYEGF